MFSDSVRRQLPQAAVVPVPGRSRRCPLTRNDQGFRKRRELDRNICMPVRVAQGVHTRANKLTQKRCFLCPYIHSFRSVSMDDGVVFPFLLLNSENNFEKRISTRNNKRSGVRRSIRRRGRSSLFGTIPSYRGYSASTRIRNPSIKASSTKI